MGEDYTTYTESDISGTITVDSATKISGLLLPRVGTDRVVKDFGAAFFDGDFVHALDFATDTPYINSYGVVVWAVSTVDSSPVNRPDILFLNYNEQGAFNHVLSLTQRSGNVLRDGATFNAGILADGTRMYVTFTRDESIGAEGELKMEVYSDAGRTTLLTTETIVLFTKEDFRYMYALASLGTGGAETWTGDVQNLDLEFTAAAAPTSAMLLLGAG